MLLYDITMNIHTKTNTPYTKFEFEKRELR